MADDPFKISMEDGAGGPLPAEGASGPSFSPATGGARGAAALRRMLAGNGLLVALVAVGIACLYGMSLMKGPASASAQQVQEQSSVDEALSKLNLLASGTGKTTADIVNTFYCEAKARQIPPSSLRENPFVFKASPPREAASRPSQELPSAPRVVESDGNADAMAAVKALKLQSVLSGARQTAAMISDNLLTEGQTIHGWTVTKISQREVHLSWKDQTYVLQMQE